MPPYHLMEKNLVSEMGSSVQNTEPFAIASAHLFGSLGGSDCVETSRLSFHPVLFWAVVG